MKKCTVLIWFTMLFSLSVHSQSYHFFPDSNAVWCADLGFKVSNQPLDTDEYHTYTYQQYLLGDTLINGTIYHKIYESGVFLWVAIPPYYFGSQPYYNQYDGCYRESNKKIFYIGTLDTTEYLLYNFNLNVGDTIPATYYNTSIMLTITSADSIYDGSSYRKKYNISTADTSQWQWPGNFEYASIVEGIGSTHGLLWWLIPYFEIHGSLFSFKQNGIVIYPDSTSTCDITGLYENVILKNEILVYPNPSFGIFTIKSSTNKLKNVIITDIQGNLIFSKNIFDQTSHINLSSYPSGIYFVKVITRDTITVDKIVIH